MEIIEASILYMKKRFPEVDTRRVENNVIFQGRFVLNVRNGDFEINIAPLLEITLPQKYPSTFPVVKDLDGTVKYDHVNSDGSLCVATVIDLQLRLNNSVCISDYIDGFLIPFFISCEYYKKTGKDIYGDRSHGIDGIFESLQEYFCISPKDPYLLKNLIAWANRKPKFKRLVPKSMQCEYIRRYSSKISVLRKLSIFRLRRICKLIELYQYGDRNKKETLEQMAYLTRLICGI